MYSPAMNVTHAIMDMDTSTSKLLHKQGAFDMDSNAIYRSLLVIGLLVVIIGVWIAIKILRARNSEMRIRRYDILSAKQLVPDHVGSDDSDDELFFPVRKDDSVRHLIPENIS
uniref:Calsyntenin-1 n=1 Tax=Elaeophora elaphi TaxID=1147741 RepID=A0A0R3RY01_9BILA